MTTPTHRRPLLSTVLVAVLAAAIALITPVSALADGVDTSQRIVTLGADLTDDERAEVLDFFNLDEDDLDDMEVIEVTNDEERDLLSDYLSDDIIGYKTMSCSYIEPTDDGGINVETANLTYVTKNTIANALETAGVENANVVVTAPYAVSGTGALTGVFLAYEEMGEDLDDDAEDAAAEELVESAELESDYGEDVTDVIADVKDEVASDGDMDADEILDLVEEKAGDSGLALDDDAAQTIADIAARAQEVGYGDGGSTGIWDSIKSFFTGIADTISDCVSDVVDAITGSGDDEADEEAAADEDASASGAEEGTDDEEDDQDFFDSLDTDVFELDDPGAVTDGSDDAPMSDEDAEGSAEVPNDGDAGADEAEDADGSAASADDSGSDGLE